VDDFLSLRKEKDKNIKNVGKWNILRLRTEASSYGG
jgi:hypothetical protein